jgi:phage-related minor tail protein
MKLKVEGHPDLVRDSHTHAVININNSKAEKARARAEAARQQSEDIEEMKKDLHELKALLQQLLDR